MNTSPQDLLSLNSLLGSSTPAHQPKKNTTSFNPGNIGPKKQITKKPTKKTNDKNIWDVDEVEDTLVDEVSDPRPQPEYKITHRQTVSTSDMYLGLSGKQNSTSQSDTVVIEFTLLETKMKDVELVVGKDNVDLRCPKYKINLPLSYKVDEEKGNAKWDRDTGKLILTLPIIPESEF